MKNQIFINDINNFKKCPEDFKIIFLKTLKSKYIGYDKIFETDYFTKLSENRIIKLLNLIKNKIREISKNNILKFYDKHTSLVKLLIDNLDIEFNNKQIIKDINTFKWKPNQIKGFESAINSNFVNGIHSQATGSGKSLMALKIMWEYHKQNPTHNLMWLCERKDIPQKLFFDIEYNENNKNIKIKPKKEIFNFWKLNDIIDMNKFEIKEYVYCKDKKWINQINNHKGKPLFIIINRAFMTTKSKLTKYRYEDLLNIPKLIIIDECHSCMADETYKLLINAKNIWKSKIHGLSATPYRNNSLKLSRLTNIFELNKKINIISSFNLKEAIENNCILEPVFFINTFGKDNCNVFSTLNNIIKKSLCKNTKCIVWCKKITNCEFWKKQFNKYSNRYNNLKNIKTYIDHSKNSDIDYDNFYKSTSDSILFCAAKHREGSDIPNLSFAIFLDEVDNRSDIVFIQSIGRVLRKNKNKQSGYIIDFYKENTNNFDSLINRVLDYYENLYDLSNYKNNTAEAVNIYKKINNNFIIENNKIVIKLKNNKNIVLNIDNSNIIIKKWKDIQSLFKKKLKKKIKYY